MSKAELTLEEIIATLERSNLPTVVTEGVDDYLCYRRIEDELKDQRISLLPVGDREMVIQVFKNRKRVRRNDVIFLIDKDLWVFGDVPDEFKHRKIITSDGYSIENDLYRDGRLERYLLDRERLIFTAELRVILEWYSFAIRRYLRCEPFSINQHPERVLASDCTMSSQFATSCGFTQKDDEIYAMVCIDYQRLLRGKTLLELLVRHLSAARRSVTFGRRQLMEIGAVEKGLYYRKIVDSIGAFFANLR